MVEIKWIKLDTGIFDDEKIKIVMAMPEGKTILIVWLRLLCLAGRLNNGGVLMINNTIPYTEEMLGAVFGESPQIMRLAIDTFHGLGMIDKCNGALYLPNWEKHQSEDALAKIRESNRLSQARHRERQKLAAGDSPVILLSSDNNTDSNDYVRIQRVENRELDTDNKTNKSIKQVSAIEQRFNALWEIYPKKQGRADALKAYKKAVLSGVTDDQIKQGIENYKQYIDKRGTEPQYIKQGGTFFNKQAWGDDYTVIAADNKPKERKIVMMN